MTGLADDVVFSYGYDVLGRKTRVAAAVGSNDDYVNAYSFDNLGRVTQITQDGVGGGNAVAEKRVDFGYSDDGTRATISRFADLAGTKAVAETEKVFDELGRVTDIVHERAATEFADYDLTWDAAGRISDFDFDSLVGDDGDATYSYDDTNQLTGSDYASDWQTDESYSYDDNGNRTNTGYTTGDHNRLLADGTYAYEYDNEGNRTAQFVDENSNGQLDSGDTSITEYTWDHRNRLTKITERATYGGAATKIVAYMYDNGQRWVRKTLDTNGDGTIEESRVFVHDDGQIVLDFEKTGTSAASNADLAHRYVWGTSADQLLADETVDDATADDTAWPLTDHLNSVRDLVVFDPVTGTVSVVKHVAYDAFGNVTSDSATGVTILFLYTARPFDADTGIQNNGFRWYDLSTGRWMSADPIGFEAGDVNLYRYVGNRPGERTDPVGLAFSDYANLYSYYFWNLYIRPVEEAIATLKSKTASIAQSVAVGAAALVNSIPAKAVSAATDLVLEKVAALDPSIRYTFQYRKDIVDEGNSTTGGAKVTWNAKLRIKGKTGERVSVGVSGGIAGRLYTPRIPTLGNASVVGLLGGNLKIDAEVCLKSLTFCDAKARFSFSWGGGLRWSLPVVDKVLKHWGEVGFYGAYTWDVQWPGMAIEPVGGSMGVYGRAAWEKPWFMSGNRRHEIRLSFPVIGDDEMEVD